MVNPAGNGQPKVASQRLLACERKSNRCMVDTFAEQGNGAEEGGSSLGVLPWLSDESHELKTSPCARRAKAQQEAAAAYNEAVAAAEYQALLAAQEAERAAALQATYARSAARAQIAGQQVRQHESLLALHFPLFCLTTMLVCATYTCSAARAQSAGHQVRTHDSAVCPLRLSL